MGSKKVVGKSHDLLISKSDGTETQKLVTTMGLSVSVLSKTPFKFCHWVAKVFPGAKYDRDSSLPLKYPMPDSPLWGDGAQAPRLAELTAARSDASKEIPLRRDIRSLGILLGRVLVEQEGEAFFDVVEHLRRQMIQHREFPAASEFDHGLNLIIQPREIVAALSVEDAYRVTKAFAIYFELANLAETNHRKRRRRAARMLAGKTPMA
jgi:hypothetical protein